MNLFSTKLIALIHLIAAAGLFYFTLTTSLPSLFLNIALFIVAIFILIQGCNGLDKINNLGDYQDDQNPDNTQNNEAK